MITLGSIQVQFWIGWLHWFTYRIWVFHPSREMVSWPWAIKHHYLLTACSGNTCVAVNSSCCSERDNRFSSITQNKERMAGVQPTDSSAASSCLEWRHSQEGFGRRSQTILTWSTNTHFLITVHQFLTTVLRWTLPLHFTEREVEIQGGGVNKPNAPECDSTFSALRYIMTNSLCTMVNA